MKQISIKNMKLDARRVQSEFRFDYRNKYTEFLMSMNSGGYVNGIKQHIKPEDNVKFTVLAIDKDDALKVAKYHYYLTGRNFKVLGIVIKK